MTEWFFAVRRCRNGHPGFIAWCSVTPDLGDGPMDVAARFDVHFEFGSNAEDALANLKRLVLS